MTSYFDGQAQLKKTTEAAAAELDTFRFGFFLLQFLKIIFMPIFERLTIVAIFTTAKFVSERREGCAREEAFLAIFKRLLLCQFSKDKQLLQFFNS